MDQNSHKDGICSWQGCGFAHPRALRANSLSLQLIPVWSKPAGKLCCVLTQILPVSEPVW